MLSQYSKVIVDSIESEKNGIDYLYSDHDKKVLTSLCNDINSHLGTSIQYLAEIDLLELSKIEARLKRSSESTFEGDRMK